MWEDRRASRSRVPPIEKDSEAVARDRTPPVVITDAPENPEVELRRREIRYVVMMVTRALCLVAGAIFVSTKPPLWGLWLALSIVGMVVLPWLAVIIANDRPARRRGRPERPTNRHDQPALPPGASKPAEHRVIEQG